MLGSTSPVQMLQGIMGTQQQLMPHQVQAIVDKMGTTEATKKAVPTDTVTISYPANMIQQLLNAEMQGPNGTVAAGESDLTGISQLKMQGDMIAGMIKMRLKSFESDLMAGLKNTGLDPSRSMELKDGGADGLLLNGAMQNDPFQQFLRKDMHKDNGLQDQFKEIAQLVDLLNVLQQAGASPSGDAALNGTWSGAATTAIPDLTALLKKALTSSAGTNLAATSGTGGIGPEGLPSAGTKYAQQSQTARSVDRQPSAQFVLRVMQGKASYVGGS